MHCCKHISDEMSTLSSPTRSDWLGLAYNDSLQPLTRHTLWCKLLSNTSAMACTCAVVICFNQCGHNFVFVYRAQDLPATQSSKQKMWMLILCSETWLGQSSSTSLARKETFSMISWTIIRGKNVIMSSRCGLGGLPRTDSMDLVAPREICAAVHVWHIVRTTPSIVLGRSN